MLYVVPEQLVFVAMLALAPLPLVPLMVAAGAVLGVMPDFLRGLWHGDRAVTTIGDCWFALGPVLVLAALAPGPATLPLAEVYVLAYLAQATCDLAVGSPQKSVDRPPPDQGGPQLLGQALLESTRFCRRSLSWFRWPPYPEPIALVALGPLVWLLEIFSRDRRERYAAALELNRAYRGTVMVLSDILEFDDEYTAHHSRSVLELVDAVADQMGIAETDRQELEFAAMLHDVGKISIPKEILHKPSALTHSEFEVIKSHTIEGQFILDRVGGVLGRVGEIVRSCHERWDGCGYPDGLQGDAIPLASRIVFACDAYNAMTTDRPYRDALASDVALDELRKHAGTQFDPEVVRALIESGRGGTGACRRHGQRPCRPTLGAGSAESRLGRLAVPQPSDLLRDCPLAEGPGRRPLPPGARRPPSRR